MVLTTPTPERPVALSATATMGNFFVAIDSGANDHTTNRDIVRHPGKQMPAALWDTGNRANAPAGVGHLRANVRGTAITLTLATRQTPTICDTLLSAAKQVDEYGMRIIPQSDAQGGPHIMTKEGVRIPLA